VRPTNGERIDDDPLDHRVHICDTNDWLAHKKKRMADVPNGVTVIVKAQDDLVLTFPRNRLEDVLRWLPVAGNDACNNIHVSDEKDGVCLKAGLVYRTCMSVELLDVPLSAGEWIALAAYVACLTTMVAIEVDIDQCIDPGIAFPGYTAFYETCGQDRGTIVWRKEVSDRLYTYDASVENHSTVVVPYVLRQPCPLSVCGRVHHLIDILLCRARYHTEERIEVAGHDVVDVPMMHSLLCLINRLFTSADVCYYLANGTKVIPFPMKNGGRWLRVATALLLPKRYKRGPVALLPDELVRKAMCSF
jgi:hypothetical protein